MLVVTALASPEPNPEPEAMAWRRYGGIRGGGYRGRGGGYRRHGSRYGGFIRGKRSADPEPLPVVELEPETLSYVEQMLINDEYSPVYGVEIFPRSKRNADPEPEANPEPFRRGGFNGRRGHGGRFFRGRGFSGRRSG